MDEYTKMANELAEDEILQKANVLHKEERTKQITYIVLYKKRYTGGAVPMLRSGTSYCIHSALRNVFFIKYSFAFS